MATDKKAVSPVKSYEYMLLLDLKPQKGNFSCKMRISLNLSHRNAINLINGIQNTFSSLEYIKILAPVK